MSSEPLDPPRSGRALRLALALVLASGCRAPAEPSIAPSWPPERAAEPLTRADCVRLAAGWAPNAAAWEARRAAARAALDQAARLPNPHVELALEELPLGGSSGVPVQTTVSLLEALGDVFARGRRRAAARAELAAEEADLRAALADLAREVRTAYDELVAVRVRVALAGGLEQIRREARDATRGYVTSGELPPVELRRADADLLEATSAREAAQAEARALEVELAFALGFERPVHLALADALETPSAVGDAGASRADPTDASTPVAAADLEPLLAEAAAARPELAATRARYEAERARLRLAADRVRFLPGVGAGPRFESGDVRGVATLDVELPLFDAGGPAENAARARLLAAAAALRRTARDVAVEVSAAAERSAAAAEAAQRAGELAERRAGLLRDDHALFEAGATTYAELERSRLDELTARRDLLDARLAAALQRLALDHALGRLTTLP